MRFWPIVSVFALVLTTAAAAQSGGEADKGDGKSGKSVEALHKDAVAKEAEAGWARATVEEREVVTRHSISVGGKTRDYDATEGTLTIPTPVWHTTAGLFYITRPLTCINHTHTHQHTS